MYFLPDSVVIDIKKYDTFKILQLLDAQRLWTVHVQFVRLTAPMTSVNDRWSGVGTVVIHCRSQAGRIPDLTISQ